MTIIKPLFLTCRTPLHAGAGSDIGVVDLPIQRERHTSFPKIESSSFKGAVRQAAEVALDVHLHIEKVKEEDKEVAENIRQNIKKINIAFGPENAESDDSHAGALGFTDARLLLFPVKSVKGVFAWITCPRALKQFESDMALTANPITIKGLDTPPEAKTAWLNGDNKLKIQDSIVLEEFAFKAKIQVASIDNKMFGKWLAEKLYPNNKYLSDKLSNDLVILTDDDFTDFVNLSTEVITRTKIDNKTGTVATGQLFTEEYLPAESVLYSLVIANRPMRKSLEGLPMQNAEDVMAFFQNTLPKVFQIGANSTLGKGIVEPKFL